MGLFAMIGLSEVRASQSSACSRSLSRNPTLRAAELAVRRLIVAAARDIMVEPRPRRPKPKTSRKDKGKTGVEAKAKRKRGFLFKLFDPPRRSRSSMA